MKYTKFGDWGLGIITMEEGLEQCFSKFGLRTRCNHSNTWEFARNVQTFSLRHSGAVAPTNEYNRPPG